MKLRIVRRCLPVVLAMTMALAACSKENNISQDENVTCNIASIPAGSCPEGYAPEVVGQAAIKDCGANGTEPRSRRGTFAGHPAGIVSQSWEGLQTLNAPWLMESSQHDPGQSALSVQRLEQTRALSC